MTYDNLLGKMSYCKDVIEAFEEVTQGRLVRVFSEEADSAMVVTRKEFKLPN